MKRCDPLKAFLVAAILSSPAAIVQPASAETYDVEMPPGTNYDRASFRLWLPEDVETLRAALVLVPGSNGDGRDQVDTPFWQELAARHQLALVGVYLTDKRHEDMFIEHYIEVRAGSGQAFVDALTRLGEMSDHSELASAPLLLWGMSAGGEFNYELALWKPERVIGFVVNKGGIYYSALASAEARRVDGFVCNPSSNRCTEAAEAPERRYPTAWLPTENPANAWRAVTTGTHF